MLEVSNLSKACKCPVVSLEGLSCATIDVTQVPDAAAIALDTISSLETWLDGEARSLKQVLGKGSLRPRNEYSVPVSLPSCLGAATPVRATEPFFSDLVSDTTSTKTVRSLTRPHQKLSGPCHDLIKNCLVLTRPYQKLSGPCKTLSKTAR